MAQRKRPTPLYSGLSTGSSNLSRGVSFLTPSGGGGGGNPDVVPGADPTRQDLGTGISTTTVTFNVPTGGTGAWTYGTVLNKPVGSAATISAGSGLGPWTVSGMTNGQCYGVKLTATDTGDSQVANNFALIDVAPALPSAVFANSRTVQRPPALVFEDGVFTIVP
jgi:hypothetical protein